MLSACSGATDADLARLLKGEPETRSSTTMIKVRVYRAAFVIGVVAVFLEGAGAGMKWF
jgi:hypothetical protein